MSDLAMSAMKKSEFTDAQRAEIEEMMAKAFCQGMQYLDGLRSARLSDYHGRRIAVPVCVSEALQKQIDAALATGRLA